MGVWKSIHTYIHMFVYLPSYEIDYIHSYKEITWSISLGEITVCWGVLFVHKWLLIYTRTYIHTYKYILQGTEYECVCMNEWDKTNWTLFLYTYIVIIVLVFDQVYVCVIIKIFKRVYRFFFIWSYIES